MITHICSSCGVRIPAGQKCKKCSVKRYKPTAAKKEKTIYDTARWQKLRDRVQQYFFYLDLISYLNDNELEFGYVVHHIIPVETDPSHQYDFENLILITESRHRLIHNRMEYESEKVITELQAERKRIVEFFSLPRG